MSRIFGAVVQQGYVVPDAQVAMAHWLARGVGPFFVEELNGLPGQVDGEVVKLDLVAAFAYSGDQQIEVIEARGGAGSIYSEFLKTHPGGGLQHVAFWVDDIDAKLAELESAGLKYVVRQRYGDAHAYIDSASDPGIMVQLMAHGDAIDELFRIIKSAADTWDGRTDPIRRIDWSTGRPVVQIPTPDSGA